MAPDVHNQEKHDLPENPEPRPAPPVQQDGRGAKGPSRAGQAALDALADAFKDQDTPATANGLHDGQTLGALGELDNLLSGASALAPAKAASGGEAVPGPGAGSALPGAAALLKAARESGIADLDAGGAAAELRAISPSSGAAPPDAESEELSQELLEALIAAATDGGEEEALVATEMAVPVGEAGAAAGAGPLLQPVPIPSQPEASAEMPQEAPRKVVPRRRPWLRGRLPRIPGPHLFRVTVTAGIAVVAGFSTYTYLYLNQERVPDAVYLARNPPTSLARVMNDARRLIELGANAEAAARLEPAIAAAAPGEDRVEAEFLRVDALYRAVAAGAPQDEIDKVVDAINDLVERAPVNPRTALLLRWKAKLYQSEGIPYAAYDLFRQTLRRFPELPGREVMLWEAAEAAKAVGRVREAALFLEELLGKYPGSAYGPQARMLLAESYAEAGRLDEARNLYARLAETSPSSRVAAEAVVQLAGIAMDRRDYGEAIRLLEARVAAATTIEGNDGVYLALARAYKAAGRLDDARRVLRDIVEFFPESDTIPKAMVLSTEVLDALNMRSQAVQNARQAAARYPGSPEVLKSLAAMLAETGAPREAGQVFMDAVAAGGRDPELLLAAARNFRKGGAPAEALEAYQSLLDTYPRAPQAFPGNIEHAELLCERGQVREGVRRLEDLAAATPEGPRRLPVLLALEEQYRVLGLHEPLIRTGAEIVALSTEPEVVAKVAIGLFDAGATDQALSVASRVDAAKTSAKTRQEFLTRYGEALLRVDPRRAAQALEQAVNEAPDAVLPGIARALVKARLAAGDSGAVQTFVRQLQEQARADPARAPALAAAAAEYGDYLVQHNDLQNAAAQYALAAGADPEGGPDSLWARYRQADALAGSGDSAAAVALWDQVAAAGSAWAEEARIKAEAVRMQQRLRGQPLPPAQEPGTAIASASAGGPATAAARTGAP